MIHSFHCVRFVWVKIRCFVEKQFQLVCLEKFSVENLYTTRTWSGCKCNIKSFEIQLPICLRFSDQFLFALTLLSFAIWINAQPTDFKEFVSDRNKTHWLNCTIDGEIKHDKECFGWLAKFITWLGFGLLIFFFLTCGCLWYCLCTLCQICCCSDRPREVIYTTYVHPITYTQIP